MQSQQKSQIQADFSFIETDDLILKFILKSKRLSKAKIILT